MRPPGSPITATRVVAAVLAAQGAYTKLVLVTSVARENDVALLRGLVSEHAWARVNVGHALSQALLDVTRRQRPTRAPELLGDIVLAARASVLLLEHIEVLFEPTLALDPLRVLALVARDTTLVVLWPGSAIGDTLTYAEPAHPEYQRSIRPDAFLVHLDSEAAA